MEMLDILGLIALLLETNPMYPSYRNREKI